MSTANGIRDALCQLLALMRLAGMTHLEMGVELLAFSRRHEPGPPTSTGTDSGDKKAAASILSSPIPSRSSHKGSQQGLSYRPLNLIGGWILKL